MLVASLTPIVRRVQNRFTRKTATTAVVTTLLLGTLGLIVFTIPPVATQLSTLSGDFDHLYRQAQTELNKSSPEFAKMLGQVKVASLPSATAPQATKELVFSAFTIITGVVTVLVLTSYLVFEGPAAATALVSVFPRKDRLQVRQMFSEIGEQVGSYIRGQLITSLLAGLTTFLVLTALSVPNALALAWVMAFADAIPIAGPIIGIVPAVVSAYSVSGEKALYVLIALVIYHQLENYWILPKVYGKALKLSPLIVLLSIMVGTSLLGIIGAFVALPFSAMMPILLRHFNQWRNQDSDPANLPGETVGSHPNAS